MQLALQERHNIQGGFPALLLGSDQHGTALITDRGFVFKIAARLSESLTSIMDWCEDNDVLFLFPYVEADDKGLAYDQDNHRLSVVSAEDVKVILLYSSVLYCTVMYFT